jgi:hypothetical protein
VAPEAQREGTYDKAVEGIREALRRGFRLTTNTTLFDGADAKRTRALFRERRKFSSP